MPPEKRSRLAGYLALGVSRAEYFGCAWCRFGCEIADSDMGHRDLTDGCWVWPEGLAHYVRDHGILLPDEFVDHALSRVTPDRQGLPESAAGTDCGPLPAIDHDYWAKWCSSRRSPAFLARLREGRLTAAALMRADRADRLATLIRQRGLGNSKCQWRDCPHRALAETYICAEHHLSDECTDDPQGRFAQALHDALGELSAALGVHADFDRPPVATAGADSFLARLVRTLRRAAAFPRRGSRVWRAG